ncbi:2-hydroxychromene-2-carboxylate isomerase/DsbA-like thioredoxin domain [Candidatus Burkholderia pumila]|uniref:2-hydroxychromene-2-carboxylate isomerase/DsbA-like thioredoxin domain n=1 Tax=Candidatus Burkholderia pumila TaxID=1090375 RepID=A0ABR5HM82_9BURK|nr:2-hydroxychromene-2-carboxylate isomerase/DsbA-like thioredoxin domain [Candidatus Burkholderia pumila]
MRYDTVCYTNMLDAHRLMTLFAETKGLAAEMTEQLFRTYSTTNLALANHDVLLDVATGIGLDRDETKQMLESDAFSQAARAAKRDAEQRGIHGVPCFVFDDGAMLYVYGAQMKTTLLEALRANWDKSRQSLTKETLICGPDGCNQPQTLK